MINISELESYLNQLLQPDNYPDYCPNGLQVSGKSDVSTIVTGVTASLALIEAAIEKQADTILVHHGYFWKHENPCITGPKHQRLKQLLAHDINLLAYHLPLDIHPELGNNVQLAHELGIEVMGQFDVEPGLSLGFVGEFKEAVSPEDLIKLINTRLQRMPLHISNHQKPIKRIAWCTGAAQDYIEQAHRAGVDAYLTGEVSERTTHAARELGIHFIAAGHHATERYGIKALGAHLAEHFGLKHYFIDIENPV